jgi:membrane-associated phospholipid phosphatase
LQSGSSSWPDGSEEREMDSARPGPGRPLLVGARPLAGATLVGCAITIAVLGVLFAQQTTADGFDRAIDAPVISWLAGQQGLARWLVFPGSLLPMAVLSGAIAVACLLAARLNGAVLAVTAIPAATGLNDGLLKHLVDRTYLGILSYPSGHAANLFALAATVAVLLLCPPQPARTRPLRVLLTTAAGVLAVVVAVGVISQRFHYFTDTVAGAAVGVSTVCALAFLLDLALVRQQLARVSRLWPTAQAKANV